jgi:hypothetical protein
MPGLFLVMPGLIWGVGESRGLEPVAIAVLLVLVVPRPEPCVIRRVDRLNSYPVGA